MSHSPKPPPKWRYYTRRQEARFKWYDLRRFVARKWKRVALAIYEWIWP